jgi:TM2 domain-containing membrane protein YozV
MYLSGTSFKKPSTILLVAFLFGLERFFLGSIGLGILKVITGYGCGIWWLIDVFTAKERAKKYNFQQFSKLTAFVGGNVNPVSATPGTQAPIMPYYPKNSSSGKGIIPLIIVIAVIALVGYFVVNSVWFYNLFSGRSSIEKLYEQNRQMYEQQTTVNNVPSRPETTQPIVQKATPTPDTDSSYRSQSSSTPGRFPEVSERLLTASDLQGLSKYDLKIMRNEIFARHGYIFQTEAMKTYFRNQSWYSPRYSNVNSWLTSIENKNIALIQRYE